MPKGRVAAGDSAVLRGIPAVERLLSSEGFAASLSRFGREQVKGALVSHLDSLRLSRTPYDERRAVQTLSAILEAATSSTLRRVINASGIIIHTNLGRSPMDPALWQRAGAIVEGLGDHRCSSWTGRLRAALPNMPWTVSTWFSLPRIACRPP